MKRKKTPPQKPKPPHKSADIPVTNKMLDEARYELKHEIESFRHEVKAEFKVVKADISKVLAAVHRVGLLVEEQNARNKYVLDGYTSLSDRLDTVEKQTKDV
jgi:hypothetical protein